MHLPDRLNGGGGRRHAWAYPPAAAVGRVVFRRQFQEAFPQVGRQRFRGHDADNILVDEIQESKVVTFVFFPNRMLKPDYSCYLQQSLNHTDGQRILW